MQARQRAQPELSATSTKHRCHAGTRHTLADGPRRDSHVVKAIEPVTGGYPDVPFAVLEQRADQVTGQAVRARVHVRAALVNVHETLARRSHPQSPITIAKDGVGPD